MKIDDIHEMAHDISNYVNEHYMLKSLNQQLFDENERLNATIDELDDSITWWTNRFNAVQRDYEELKAKIDKAIEILHDDNYCHIEKLQKINEILGDKENE